MVNILMDPDQFNISKKLRRANLLDVLKYILSISNSKSLEHCIRAFWIGMNVGKAIGFSQAQLWDLYYILLLEEFARKKFNYDSMFSTNGNNNTIRKNSPESELVLGVEQVILAEKKLHDELLTYALVQIDDYLSRAQLTTNAVKSNGSAATIAKLFKFSNTVVRVLEKIDRKLDTIHDMSDNCEIIYLRVSLFANFTERLIRKNSLDGTIGLQQLLFGDWPDRFLISTFKNISSSSEFWATLSSNHLVEAMSTFEPPEEDFVLDSGVDNVASALLLILEVHDAYASKHCRRVGYLAGLIAQELKLSAERTRCVVLAGALHDIGKIGISREILGKSGWLDPGEWEKIKQHAVYTREILQRLPIFSDIAQISSAHHERLDGQGYPEGLKDQQIYLETRIVTIADIFDSLISDRPYRSATSVSEALSIMSSMIGTAVDGSCFDALKTTVGRINSPAAA